MTAAEAPVAASDDEGERPRRSRTRSRRRRSDADQPAGDEAAPDTAEDAASDEAVAPAADLSGVIDESREVPAGTEPVLTGGKPANTDGRSDDTLLDEDTAPEIVEVVAESENPLASVESVIEETAEVEIPAVETEAVEVAEVEVETTASEPAPEPAAAESDSPARPKRRGWWSFG